MNRIVHLITFAIACLAAVAQTPSALSLKIDSVMLLNDPDSARYLRLVDETVEMAISQGNKHDVAQARYARITYLANKYGAEAALPHLAVLREYVENIQSEEPQLYNAWANVILYNQEQGNVVAATAELKKMQDYANSQNNDYGRAMSYLMFGVLYQYSYIKAKENLAEAMEYFRLADALLLGFPQYYFYMAKVAFNAQKYQEAADCANKMLATAQDKSQTQLAYAIMLKSYMALKDMDSASHCFSYLDEAWKEYEVVGTAERYAIEAMSQYLCQTGQPAAALDMLKYIPEEYVIDRMRLQIMCASATNQYQKAYNLLQQLLQVVLKQNGEQQSSDVSSANALLNNQTLEREKLQLEISNKNKTMVLAIVIIIALAAIVTATGIIIFTIRRNSRKLKIEHDLVIEERNKAVQLNKMKDLFINNMSHEMRTPLNSIIGFNELLNSSRHNIGEKERANMLKHINFHATNLTGMLNHAIILNRIDCNDAEPLITDVKLGTLIGSLVEEITPQLNEGVKIDAEQAIKCPYEVRADRDFLTIAIREVLDNAAKFTAQGKITVDVQRIHNGKIQIAVQDTGPGIPHEKANAIFNRFEKIGSFELGFGLGLSCAREVLSTMGGSIYLDTSTSPGSRFLIII